jgi:hypothetical protein
LQARVRSPVGRAGDATEKFRARADRRRWIPRQSALAPVDRMLVAWLKADRLRRGAHAVTESWVSGHQRRGRGLEGRSTAAVTNRACRRYLALRIQCPEQVLVFTPSPFRPFCVVASNLQMFETGVWGAVCLEHLEQVSIGPDQRLGGVRVKERLHPGAIRHSRIEYRWSSTSLARLNPCPPTSLLLGSPIQRSGRLPVLSPPNLDRRVSIRT